MDGLGVYILTYEAPKQLELFLNRLKNNQPKIYNSNKFLLNNSDKKQTIKEYESIDGGYEIIHHSRNIGITEARVLAALHSYNNFKYHLYFEDDHLCKDHNFIETAMEIVDTYDLDYLRLSFNDSYGRNQWNRMGSQKTDTKILNELSFIIEDSFYSNYPILFSRNGIRKLFIESPTRPDELVIADKAKKLMQAKVLRTGCLLVDPFEHDRQIKYVTERKEHINGICLDKYRLMAMMATIQ